MMSYIFGAAMVLAALFAAFSRTHRASVLFLWAAGLAAGGLYLGLGFELLALIQWIVSTLTALATFFFLVVFDEKENEDLRPLKQRVLAALPAVLAGGAFASAVIFALLAVDSKSVSEPVAADGIAALGHALVGQHLISLQILGLLLFVGLVGGGVIVRPFLKGKEEA